MLAFHRLVERRRSTRSVVLGVLLWATALACAYYGIFAGLMVGLGTLLFAFSRQLWRSVTTGSPLDWRPSSASGWRVPFFLPYIYVQRNWASPARWTMRDSTAADLGAWGASSAWAHRWWLPVLGDFREVLFPGVIARVGIAGP